MFCVFSSLIGVNVGCPSVIEVGLGGTGVDMASWVLPETGEDLVSHL